MHHSSGKIFIEIFRRPKISFIICSMPSSWWWMGNRRVDICSQPLELNFSSNIARIPFKHTTGLVNFECWFACPATKAVRSQGHAASGGTLKITHGPVLCVVRCLPAAVWSFSTKERIRFTGLFGLVNDPITPFRLARSIMPTMCAFAAFPVHAPGTSPRSSAGRYFRNRFV